MDRVTQIKWQMKITNYVNCECEKINMGDFIHKMWPVDENLDVKHNKNERYTWINCVGRFSKRYNNYIYLLSPITCK